jgi:hypothetical protein
MKEQFEQENVGKLYVHLVDGAIMTTDISIVEYNDHKVLAIKQHIGNPKNAETIILMGDQMDLFIDMLMSTENKLSCLHK